MFIIKLRIYGYKLKSSLEELLAVPFDQFQEDVESNTNAEVDENAFTGHLSGLKSVYADEARMQCFSSCSSLSNITWICVLPFGVQP